MMCVKIRLVCLLMAAALLHGRIAMGEAPAGQGPAFVDAPAAVEAGDFGGKGITRAQLEQYLPSAKPHPFDDGKNHVVRQLNGEKKPVVLPAEIQWISKSWKKEDARCPSLVYMPEKDRLLLIMASAKTINSSIQTSDDHGATWSERRWLSLGNAAEPTRAFLLGLTYLGQGKLMAIPDESVKSVWFSSDYGQTWELRSDPKPPQGETATWDPVLGVSGDGGNMKRVVQGCYKPTGVPWQSPDGAYSQGYLRSSLDLGQTWSDLVKVPQWLGVNEINFIIAKNGDWVAACRTDYPSQFAHLGVDHYGGLGMSISKDQGKTWSDLNILYQWGRHHPSMVLLPDGRILMSYIVRLGYPKTPDDAPQFGVEAVLSSDNGQTWDMDHRYILTTWVGNVTTGHYYVCSVQSSTTVAVPDGTILTSFGSGFTNTVTEGDSVKLDVALVKWRLNP